MDELEEMRRENESRLGDVFESALAKCKVAMDAGPSGENVTLTPEEATLIYRMFTEGCGVKAEQDRIHGEIEEARRDIARGARRSDHRFRL